jgi:hypothetical protein
MKLHGPRPVSQLTIAMQENGKVCDTAHVRCEVILTGDGEMLCWRAWGHNGRRWIPSRWKSPTEKCAPFETLGGAA